MKYYLFNEDKIEEDIDKYKKTVDEEEISHFDDYYGNKFPVIQGVYVRLYMEMERRRKIGLIDSSKAFYGIYSTVVKIAKRLNTTVYEFVANRFYPFFAEMRNKRYRQFYKNYSGKK